MTKKQELAATAEGTSQEPNTQLFETENVEGTPFHVVSHDNGHFLALGHYRLTEDLPTKDDVHNHIKLNWWELLLNVVTVMIETITKHKDHAQPN